MSRHVLRSIWVGIVAIVGICGHAVEAAAQVTRLDLTSSSMQAGTIPQRYACVESGAAPAFAWSQPPVGTQSFAVIARDLDSPMQFMLGPFIHWVIYNIPATERSLPDALPPRSELPNGIRQGLNGFSKIGFGGPCPPGSSPHRYEFTLYALDITLNLPGDVAGKAVEKGMEGHILATGRLVATYKRP